MSTLQDTTKNPLNIRFDKRNNWQGQIGRLKGFCMFRNEAYGFRAAYVLINNYIKRGVDSVAKIVERWSPPSENNTETYIDYVCREAFCAPETKLSSATEQGYWEILTVLRAMAKMECGKWYEEQTINLYINYPNKF